MSTRLVHNFIDEQRSRVLNASRYVGDCTGTSASTSVQTEVSTEEALTNVGIAYLRFTGNNADKALAEIICGIALMLGNISEANPIGKIGDHQREIEALITQYKTATELLSPVFGALGTLVSSTLPEANVAGFDLAKCLQSYTELIVYQDRRRITHKDDFLAFIKALIYETKNGITINPEAIVLTPPPSAPRLPAPIKYENEINNGNCPPETTGDRPTQSSPKSPKREPKSTSVEEVLAKLQNLIGLASVKRDVQETIDLIKYQKMLRQQGDLPIAISRHMVFTGNPGTGKTTIARILGEIYKHLGVLSKGHMVETDRAGLVAGYLGQTAIKTEEVVSSAIGGILFIDEAYALTNEDKDQFGQEAIDTLLKRMEDYRDDFIVIVAGYPEEMSRFVNANPGLQSRFTKYIHFDDYGADELYQIYKLLLSGSGHHYAPTNDEYIRDIFLEMDRLRDSKFGNGRTVRNLYEKTMSNIATRVVRTMPKDIKEILPDDVATKDLYSVLQIKDGNQTNKATLTSQTSIPRTKEAINTPKVDEKFSDRDKFFSCLGKELFKYIDLSCVVNMASVEREMESFVSEKTEEKSTYRPALFKGIGIIESILKDESATTPSGWMKKITEALGSDFDADSIEATTDFVVGYMKNIL